MGLYAAAAAAFPAEAKDTVIDENHVEPGTNDDRPQAWMDSTDGGDGKEFNISGSSTTTYAAAEPEILARQGSTSLRRVWRLGGSEIRRGSSGELP